MEATNVSERYRKFEEFPSIPEGRQKCGAFFCDSESVFIFPP